MLSIAPHREVMGITPICIIVITELSVEAIGKGVEWASMLPQDKFHKLIRENIYYSTQTWNLEQFENEFRSTLKETIKTKERKNK